MISLKTTPQRIKSIHAFAVCGFEAKTTALLCFCWCIILTFNFSYFKCTWHFTTRISVSQDFPATGTKVLYKQKDEQQVKRRCITVRLCDSVYRCWINRQSSHQRMQSAHNCSMSRSASAHY